MTISKPKRIVDEELLETVRGLPCLACASIDPAAAQQDLGENRNDAHHVKTRGSGGDDVPGNVMPLCRVHHTLWHRYGMKAMAERFAVIREWLKLTGHL